jgi:hypothetical protein
VETEEAGGVEAHEPGPLGLDGGAHRLESHEVPLPDIGHTRGIGRDEGQPRAARERLAEPHAGMDAVSLRGERYLADLLYTARLGRESGRRLEQLGTIAGRDRELEAGEKDADD